MGLAQERFQRMLAQHVCTARVLAEHADAGLVELWLPFQFDFGLADGAAIEVEPHDRLFP